MQSDVAAAVEDAVQVLARLGHRVERVAGGPPDMGRAWGLLGAFLLGARLREELPGREHLVGRGLVAGFKTAATMSQDQWGALAAMRAEICRARMAGQTGLHRWLACCASGRGFGVTPPGVTDQAKSQMAAVGAQHCCNAKRLRKRSIKARTTFDALYLGIYGQ